MCFYAASLLLLTLTLPSLGVGNVLPGPTTSPRGRELPLRTETPLGEKVGLPYRSLTSVRFANSCSGKLLGGNVLFVAL
jgi:hypothetical protein